MVHANGGNHLYHSGFHHIGGIQSASQSCLQHYDVTFLFFKIQKGQGSLHFKYRWISLILCLHGIHCLFDDGHQGSQSFPVYHFPIHLDPFPVGIEGGGDVPACPQARSGKDCRHI